MFPSIEDGERVRSLFVVAVGKGVISWPQDMTPSQFVKLCEWAQKPLMPQEPAVMTPTVEGSDRLKAILVAAVRDGFISCWPQRRTLSEFVHLFEWSQKPLMTQPAVMTQTSNGTHDGQKSSHVPNKTITSSMSRKIGCNNPFYNLEIGPEAPVIFNCVVRMSKGYEVKFKKLGLNEEDSFVFPYNMGYIPRTRNEEDQEGIEVLVVMQEPVAEKYYYIKARAIGILPMFDPISSVREDKIIAVCADDPEYSDCKDIKNLPPHRLAELRFYFEDFKEKLNPNLVSAEFLPATKAYEAIQHSMNL